MKIAYLPLQIHSRFHFGEMKLDHDLALSDTSLFAHSDTLFAGLVNGYAAHYGDAGAFISMFQREAISISSLFYFLQSGSHKVHFLPKPIFLAIDSPKSQNNLHKKRNRIQMVSTGVWQKGFDAVNWFDEQQYRVIQDAFVMTKEEYDGLNTNNAFNIATIVLSPKSPKRGPENAAIFYQADVEIGGNAQVKVGWYYIYKADEASETALKVATNIVAYTGIGGEVRNMGRTIEQQAIFSDVDLFVNMDTSHFINIALLNPLDEDAFRYVKYYRSTLRGGRALSSGGHSKVVRMITEGALILSDKLKGQLVDLGKDESNYTLYRNGLPFLIPVQYDY